MGWYLPKWETASKEHGESREEKKEKLMEQSLKMKIEELTKLWVQSTTYEKMPCQFWRSGFSSHPLTRKKK